jgi:hypothetical protein
VLTNARRVVSAAGLLSKWPYLGVIPFSFFSYGVRLSDGLTSSLAQ